MNQNILGWKSKVLSRAGREALIHSDLNSYHVLWTAAFSLPLQVIDKMERLFRDFLWSGAYLKKTMGRVEWETVFKPRSQGIRRIRDIHTAAYMRQVWNFCCKQKGHFLEKMGKNEICPKPQFQDDQSPI